MKRPRPHIPFEARCRVLLRMLGWTPEHIEIRIESESPQAGGIGYVRYHLILLEELRQRIGFKGIFHLDHDPPLRARPFDEATGKYTPDANDPDHLVYRDAVAHKIKTLVRGEHGQFSDLMLINRERKRERKEKGRQRPKTKWPQGRKLQSRGFDKRPRT